MAIKQSVLVITLDEARELLYDFWIGKLTNSREELKKLLSGNNLNFASLDVVAVGALLRPDGRDHDITWITAVKHDVKSIFMPGQTVGMFRRLFDYNLLDTAQKDIFDDDCAAEKTKKFDLTNEELKALSDDSVFAKDFGEVAAELSASDKDKKEDDDADRRYASDNRSQQQIDQDWHDDHGPFTH
jgi:hypothetical protein